MTSNGAQVYPVHQEIVGRSPVNVRFELRTAAPRRGVRSLGIGMGVDGGHVLLNGRQLMGVDVWSDAMTGGIDLQVCPTESEAAISLSPVWVDDTDAVVSWSGNYGMLITRERGHIILHCSTGVGPPDFTELVVEFTTGPTPPDPIPAPEASRYSGALYELAVAMHGRGEEDQACELWSQAAALGHLAAAYDLGVVHFRRGDLAEAERWWRTAAEYGDARAMAGLAEVLDRCGNISEARVWRAACAAESHSR
ncbi:tetratricopeptide repeat protein [Nocardia crassostreae]|uniref:tetratricopeptide repeat protein n=1 Tax=Nocardia crassostreae TaxID=53428 RepID=UPI001470F9D0|nr:tetratricopeptide repeat protein [Nocardia crassostreae]